MLQLNPIEKDMFIRLSEGSDGKTLRAYCNKVLNSLVDIRNIPDDEPDAKRVRGLVVRMLQDNFINHLTARNSDLQSPEPSEFE